MKILLVIGGGIAAYKSCELIRLARKAGHEVRCILTNGGAQFVTPMTLAALSEQPVHTGLWDLKDEVEIGHIQLSRQADLIVVAPATADLLAKMAAGIADDLATTVLLATDKPVLAAPTMNVRMWQHAATQRNVATLRDDGIAVLDPDEGAMACGEFGPGRLPEPAAILQAIADFPFDDRIAASAAVEVSPGANGLTGKHVIITAGPTHEAIDPVRYIANRSSGRQGYAIAAAAARAGAKVTLISGPVALFTPPRVTRIDVASAREMAAAVAQAGKADVAIMVAAVADWRVATAPRKLKKEGGPLPSFDLVENPDILATLAQSADRPDLLIGFAAETDNVVPNATAKRLRKGADWIVANDVSRDVFGSDGNMIHLITAAGVEDWPRMGKDAVADRLVAKIAAALA